MKQTIADIVDLWNQDRICFWIISALGVAFLYCLGRIFCFTKQDAAAWIQAIGSIGGILFAFYWGTVQERQTSKRMAEEKCGSINDNLNGVLETAKSINAKISICNLRMNTLEYSIQRPHILELRTALEAIPLHQYPFSAIAVELLNLKKEIDHYITDSDAFLELNNEQNFPEEEWEEKRNTARTTAEMVITRYSLLELKVDAVAELARIRSGL